MDAPNASCGVTEEGGERNTTLLFFKLLTFFHPNTSYLSMIVAGGHCVTIRNCAMIPNII